jgi:hypothetical protein
MLRPGDQVTLCRKVMGRRPGEPLDRITDVEIVSVRREPLNAITAAGVAAEGLPQMTPAQFVSFFCGAHRGCAPDTEITVIEWRYPGHPETDPAADRHPNQQEGPRQ